jgi:isopenicillin-N N-acyltransferase like protein
MSKKKLSLVILSVCFCTTQFAANELKITAKAANGHGLLCLLQGQKQILFIDGSPEQMGTAHGQLLGADIKAMSARIMTAGTASRKMKNGWFMRHIKDVERRTKPYTPQRFIKECNAMSKAAGLSNDMGRHMNFFPEMFHCSGIAVRGKASLNGQVIHARVLDYMCKIGLQRNAVIMVFMPQNYNNWISQSYAGFVGTVTAMNQKGLAMGEIGGRGGEGKWDGLSMTFLMRRIMEECSTVDEALVLMKKNPLTCEYYYVLSDKAGNIASVIAFAGKPEPVKVLKPGQQYKQLPFVPLDTVFISAKNRAESISKRLKKHYGKIDAKLMIDIIKRPVAMKSNLHNAVFLPQQLTMYFSDAGEKTIACNEPYFKVNLNDLISFYKKNISTK